LAIALFFIAINGYLVTSVNKKNAMDDLGQPLAAEYVQHDLNPYETNELP